LLLYTDGVTEAMNGVEELYGEERLQRLLDEPAGSFVDGVIADVRRHTGEVPQSDDITLLAVTYRGRRHG
jgi:sigma-B regulation protein RsbU (phosphoserine phosphatase)